MELWRFKVKESMLFVEQKLKINENETKLKMENPTNTFGEANLLLKSFATSYFVQKKFF